MNKLIIILCFLFLGFDANSQSVTPLPYPINGTWLYHNVTLGGSLKDTLIQTQILPNDSVNTYTIEGIPQPCPGEEWTTASTIKWIRPEGNKWYLNGQEYLNWDMQEGDTIYFPFANMAGDFLVSNIDTIVTLDNVQRRTYHLLTLGFGAPYVQYYYGVEFYFIEGIGATVFGTGDWYTEDPAVLTCFYDGNGLEIYHQDYTELGVYDCCNYVGIEEQETITIRLYPSPASEQINLQFEAAHIPQSIQIFNATGQLMLTENVLGRLQMQVNISEYAKGIYTVRGRFENGEEVSEKLVVE